MWRFFPAVDKVKSYFRPEKEAVDVRSAQTPRSTQSNGLKVRLLDIKPPIWRRIPVASDITLDKLHHVIQDARGWTNYHLHKFRVAPTRKGHASISFLSEFDMNDGREFADQNSTPETQVQLDQEFNKPGHRMQYLYDFGDGWAHEILLEDVQQWETKFPVAEVLKGKRACSPEDFGGPYNYQDFLESGTDIRFEDEDDELGPEEFDPNEFDLDLANQLLEDYADLLGESPPHDHGRLRLPPEQKFTSRPFARDRILPNSASNRYTSGMDITAYKQLVEDQGIVSATQNTLDAIHRSDLNAFTQIFDDAALARARELETLPTGARGRLHGVAIAVKDELAVKGFVTGSGTQANSTPALENSHTVQRLEDEGAIIIGHTTMPEFGAWPFTESTHREPTKNPYNGAFSPGGSSGGTAVAVAAGLLSVAIGSDGGGSIRIPSAHCGLIGLKPARGRVSPYPKQHGWWSLGTIGPLTTTIEDTALVYDIISGNRETDRYTTRVKTSFTNIESA